MPEEQPPPPPPELVQEVEPALSVKKLLGHGRHVVGNEAERVVDAVFTGQGVGASEPAGQ